MPAALPIPRPHVVPEIVSTPTPAEVTAAIVAITGDAVIETGYWSVTAPASGDAIARGGSFFAYEAEGEKMWHSGRPAPLASIVSEPATIEESIEDVGAWILRHIEKIGQEAADAASILERMILGFGDDFRETAFGRDQSRETSVEFDQARAVAARCAALLAGLRRMEEAAVLGEIVRRSAALGPAPVNEIHAREWAREAAEIRSESGA